MTATPAEMIQSAVDLLERAGVVYKIWTIEDLLAEIDQCLNIPADRAQEVAEAAMGTDYWRDLADCTDQDWMRVSSAIDDACGELGL